MRHTEAIHEAERGSRLLAEPAGPGEQIEAVSTVTWHRKHVVSADGIRTGRPHAERSTLLRLAARGRDVYVAADGPATGIGPALRRAAHDMIAYGRVARQHAPAARDTTDWDPALHEDRDLADGPTAALGLLWSTLQQWAGRAANLWGVELQAVQCTVGEQLLGEAMASSTGLARAHARTVSEVKVLYAARRQDQSIRMWAVRHTARVQDLDIAGLTCEAAWRASALMAPRRPRPQGATLLFAPRPAASILRVVAQDQLDRRTGGDLGVPLPVVLVDDPHAVGGSHARPFDHEGSPTGPVALLDRQGRRATMTSRGDAAGALTGNALRSVHVATPEPALTNVRVTGDHLDVPPDFTGLIAYNTRGEGTQGHRAGDRIAFRVDTATVVAGHVVACHEPEPVVATSAELLSRIAAAAPPSCYFPWRDFSTAGSWLRVQVE